MARLLLLLALAAAPTAYAAGGRGLFATANSAQTNATSVTAAPGNLPACTPVNANVTGVQVANSSACEVVSLGLQAACPDGVRNISLNYITPGCDDPKKSDSFSLRGCVQQLLPDGLNYTFTGKGNNFSWDLVSDGKPYGTFSALYQAGTTQRAALVVDPVLDGNTCTINMNLQYANSTAKPLTPAEQASTPAPTPTPTTESTAAASGTSSAGTDAAAAPSSARSLTGSVAAGLAMAGTLAFALL